jgi:hypothetical protein
LGATPGHDLHVQLAGEGRDDTCTESDLRDTCVLVLALPIIGYRQLHSVFRGVARHHDEPAFDCIAECVLQRTDLKFGDNQSAALGPRAIRVAADMTLSRVSSRCRLLRPSSPYLANNACDGLQAVGHMMVGFVKQNVLLPRHLGVLALQKAARGQYPQCSKTFACDGL